MEGEKGEKEPLFFINSGTTVLSTNEIGSQRLVK